MKEFRWGILGTGFAARQFARSLDASPQASVAVVASRSRDNAEAFAAEFGIPNVADSYESAASMENVDAFHIATPPTLHRDHALLCLEAGKAVLIEKPFATDLAAAREILEAARATGRFCMEGMWTRFLPLMVHARDLVASGAVGEVRQMVGSFGIADIVNPNNSLYDAGLGGGAFIHRGVYPLSLAYHLLGPPDHISSTAVIGETGVDEETAVTLRYNCGAVATLTASLRTRLSNDFTVMGTQGRLHLNAPVYRPHRMSLARVQVRGDRKPSRSRLGRLKQSAWIHALYQQFGWIAAPLVNRKVKHIYRPYEGNGMHYEAEELMRCVRMGLTESETMSWSDTLGVMKVLDEVRVQCGEEGMSRKYN